MCLPNGRTHVFAPTKTPITLLDPKHNFDAFALLDETLHQRQQVFGRERLAQKGRAAETFG